MARHYCTYFDRNYLVKGLALLESLRQQEPAGFTLYVVCLDEVTRTLLTAMRLPDVVTIPVHEIERGDEALRAAKGTRSLVEYYWTLTPTIILRLLERYPSIDVLTYLDADLYLFGSPQPIFDELGGHSILIHEHRFSPAQRLLGTHNGTYNVGWLSFRRNATGREALSWWRARCLEWCQARYEDGKMGDQMYLNDWPTRFPDLVVLSHVGGGVGPWNHDQYVLSVGPSGEPQVDGQPVIFYHFHAFTMVNPDLVLPVKHPHYPIPQRALGLFFLPYLYAIERAASAAQVLERGFSGGLQTEEEVTDRHTFVARHRYAAALQGQAVPQRVVALDAEWDAYCSEQVVSDRHAAQPHLRKVPKGDPPPAPTAPIQQGVSATDVRELPADVVALTSAWGTVVAECRRLGAMLNGQRSDPEAAAKTIRTWLETWRDDASTAWILERLRRRSLSELAQLPDRVTLAGHYVGPSVTQLLGWLVTSNETTNFTYDLTDLNKTQLAWFVATLASISASQALRYMEELEQDNLLREHVRKQTEGSPCRATADPTARYGRRLGWYALVRAMKPRIVVETGVDKGLGTCVLAAALLKNRAEWAEGRLYATDIDPKAGYLFTEPYAQVGTIIYGDSIATLTRLDVSIDLFIADSAHEPDYEAREYACVAGKLSQGAIVLADNAHASPALSVFAEQTGRRFGFFREQPQGHFYPGAGIGAAYVPSAPASSSAVAAASQPMSLASRDEGARSVPAAFGEVADGGKPSAGPRVSVVVSSYNAEAHIWACLEDLERQTIASELEIIVVDAASPQQERVIIEAFQQRYANITFVRTPTRVGVYAAWNLALRLARGRYVTPFSTNDQLNPEAYAKLAEALDAHPDVTLVYGDTYITKSPHESFERHTRVATWYWPEFSYEELCQRCLVGPHPMWRRAIHQELGYFDESYQALGDQEFWLRMGQRHRLMHLPYVTGLYWLSEEGLSNRPELAGPEERRLRRAYPHPTPTPAASREPSPESPGSNILCSVIIPVWNRCELTQQCLAALASTTTDVTWELIVVDNGSTDETQALLATVSGEVKVIRNQGNLGFAKACNQGAAAARGRYLVFLNNDTIPLAGWLGALVAEVEAHPEVAVVGSRLLFPDNTIQHAGVVFSKIFHSPYHIHQRIPGNHRVVNQRREFQAVTGACLLVRRTLFEAVGGLDEGYRNGFEDVDFCLKIREKGGKVVYQPASVLYHLESQSPGRKAHDRENVERLRTRWAHHWWLTDEDVYYVADGYAPIVYAENGRPRYRLQPLDDPNLRAQWHVVADVQQHALRREMGEVRRVLSCPEAWPEDLVTLQWAANLCKVVGMPDQAQPFWERILAIGEDVPARVVLAEFALKQGRLDVARGHLDAAQQQAPNDAQVWLVRGVLNIQQEAFDQAVVAFERAQHCGADPRKAQLGLCMALVGQARPEAAWEVCQRVLERYADDQEALHWLIRLGTTLQRWKDLNEKLGRYVARNPGDLAARFAHAGVLVRLGQRVEAERECDTIRALNPEFEGLEELTQAVHRGAVVPLAAEQG